MNKRRKLLKGLVAAPRFELPPDIAELNSAVRVIEIRGKRLPAQALAMSGVEAPAKK